MNRPAVWRRPLRAQRDKVLARDNGKCAYCSSQADAIDHVIPWSATKDNSDGNLVACCRRCNSLAGSRVFDSFELKRQFILGRIAAEANRNIYGFAKKLRLLMQMKRLTAPRAAAICGIELKVFEKLLEGRNHPLAGKIIQVQNGLDIHFVMEDFE